MTSRPWAIWPAAFRPLVDQLRLFSGDQQAFFDISDFIVPREGALVDEEGTGHVSISGALGDNMPPIWGKFGNTDYRQLRSELAEISRSGAERLVLHVDSPGGMVSGLEEAGQAILDTGLATAARVDGMACSAAYYLACCADLIEATPSSDVGNIGTVLCWADDSAFWEGMGVEFHVMTNEGADLKGTFRDSPMTDSQREFLQEELNRVGADFRHHVEGNRDGIDPMVFRAGWYSGDQALGLGLIDTVLR
jgi:protease-4